MQMLHKQRQGLAPSRASARMPGQSRARVVRVQAKVNVEQLKGLKEELYNYINSRGCNPIIVRLAWHDRCAAFSTCWTPRALPFCPVRPHTWR